MKNIILMFTFFMSTNLFANKFDPASVPCAMDAKEYNKMYIGTKGDYEWKKGLAQISKSTGFYDTKEIKPTGKNFCQVELEQHQCLSLFLDKDWEKSFGTHDGDFSCVNLNTGEIIPPTEIAYKNKVSERMLKMRCPNKNGISDCSNDSNSKRGTDFKKEVLDKNNLEMEAVCAGYIREPRYFTQGKVGDKALCALTNQKGEALYKVIIPMEYRYMQPLKKIDGTTVSYKPEKITINPNDMAGMEKVFMQETPLGSMAGTQSELVAISTRCTSRMLTALDKSGAPNLQIEQNKKLVINAIAKWSDKNGIVIPGNGSTQDKLKVLSTAHQSKYGSSSGASGLEADMKSCIPIYQQTGLY